MRSRSFSLYPLTRANGLQHRPSYGERSGLVEHDDVEMRQPLERFSAFEEHAELRSAAHGHGERRGNGETHGAGAGDDEHGDGAGQGQWKRMGGEPSRRQT